MEILGFAKSILFQFLNPSDKNVLSDLISRWSSPFKLPVGTSVVANYRIWNWKV